MLFSSPIFYLFFGIYFALHLTVPAKYRTYLFIGGGAVFYAWWRVGYAWIPFFLTATAYGGVRWMERAQTLRSRKRRATAAIVVLFLPLLIFKYTNFICRDVLGPIFGWRAALLNVPLPLGVSFITFTLCAYIVDSVRGRFDEQHSGTTVGAYVLFFPHLIAGPILRPHELIPQLERPRRRALRRFAVPIALFTLGLVKKLVFADQIAQTVDALYPQAGTLTAPSALLAIYGFSAQIYCDFSGYTDMALGLALMLGVRLPNNFFRPYAAGSIVDFWRRWHVTLSYWLRDYIYIPLGGNRHGRFRQAVNVIVTMAIGGLWHGANWTFVIWGFLHGIGVAVGHGMRLVTRSIPGWLAVLITFHFVTIGWVFFRAPSIHVALAMLHDAVSGFGWSDATAVVSANIFVVVLLALFFGLHRFDDHREVKAAVRSLRPDVLWPVIVTLWVIAITISQGSSAKFIYFDF